MCCVTFSPSNPVTREKAVKSEGILGMCPPRPRTRVQARVHPGPGSHAKQSFPKTLRVQQDFTPAKRLHLATSPEDLWILRR